MATPAVSENAPVFVSSEATAAVFSWEEAVAALIETYASEAPAAALPARMVASDEEAWFRVLPALPPGRRYFGAKLMAKVDSAHAPGVEYVIVLYDRETSAIAAFVDGHDVTAYRTAATSAAALDRLAPEGPVRLGVLGSGLEATMHVRAFAAVRSIRSITVFSTTPARREAFAAAAAADLGVTAEAVGDAASAVAGADVVLAAARSHGERPILMADWLPPVAAIVSIGSVVPSQRELDSSVIDASDLIVCDRVHEVVEQSGDMLAATRAGITFHDRTHSLHELLSGRLDDAVRRARRPMFKSVGDGVQDIVVAEILLRRATEAGLVTPLPMHFDKRP